VDDCYSLFELYEMNGRKFGFRITNWRPVHYVAEVIDYGFFSNEAGSKQWVSFDIEDSGEVNIWHHRFLCNLFDRSTGELVKTNVIIIANHEKLWLPA
jgi:hypothetical protein